MTSMKRSILVAGLLLCLIGPTFAQSDEHEVVLSDVVMKQVIGRILKFYFRPRRTPTTIYISEEMIDPSGYPRSATLILRS